MRCAGVDRVLDEFLDDARRALDHLARRDAVDRLWRKLPDRHPDCPPFKKRLSAFGEALLRQDFRELDSRLIERIKLEQATRENRFDHKVHQ